MSEIDDLIRSALREDAEAPTPDETLLGRVLDHFTRRSSLLSRFAWMKMGGTLVLGLAAALLFFVAESTRWQIAWAAAFVMSFSAFGMWWIWYWMMLNRNAALRELKRIELQIAELRSETTGS